MAKYTTGALAKRCNVSVRTVQYYDSRGLLVPTALSEGGRRLYSQADLDRLQIICFLRELGLPIDSIKEIFSEEHPEQVIALLLQEQERTLRGEIMQKQEQITNLVQAQKALNQLSQVSVESIGDIAHIMKDRKKLWMLRLWMLVIGFFMDAIEASTLMYWIFTGIWWPFALGMVVAVMLGVYVSILYFTSTAYICPQCHGVFKPGFRHSFFARHTPHTRKLICPHCAHHGFCVEIYGKDTESC